MFLTFQGPLNTAVVAVVAVVALVIEVVAAAVVVVVVAAASSRGSSSSSGSGSSFLSGHIIFGCRGIQKFDYYGLCKPILMLSKY